MKPRRESGLNAKMTGEDDQIGCLRQAAGVRTHVPSLDQEQGWIAKRPQIEPRKFEQHCDPSMAWEPTPDSGAS